MPSDLTAPQRIAVSCAVNRAMTTRHHSVSPDDMYQIGAEALLRVKVNEELHPAQQHVYMEMRARGAMLDATRTSYRQMAHIDPINDDDERAEFTQSDSGAAPDRLLAVYEACRRIERMPKPYQIVAAMTAAGSDCNEIAVALGVSPARVSQQRKAIRKVLEDYL